MSTKTYRINEIFYSIQGEGVRAGTAAVFVRFSGCNMRCDVLPGERSPGGFACDTEFESGTDMTAVEIMEAIARSTGIVRALPWVVLTGGEPALQVDADLCDKLHALGYQISIETNGSKELPWKAITVEPPPMAADDLYRVTMLQDGYALHGFGPTEQAAMERFNEAHCDRRRLFYPFDWIVVSPKVAEHAIKQRWADEVRYVRGAGQALPKPAIEDAAVYMLSPASSGDQIDPAAVATCVELVKTNPAWRLSLPMHKFAGVR